MLGLSPPRWAALVVLVMATSVGPASACSTDYQVVFVNCSSARDCSFRGACDLSTGQCFCEHGRLTFPASHAVGCNYAQKQQLTAVLLSAFLGVTGADQFYLGHYDLGAGKLVYVWGGLLVMVCVFSAAQVCTSRAPAVAVLAMCLVCLWATGGVVWYLYDFIRLAACQQLDARGAPLQSA